MLDRRSAVVRLKEFLLKPENFNRWISKQELYKNCYPKNHSHTQELDFFMSRSMDVSMSKLRKLLYSETNFGIQTRKIDKKPHIKINNVVEFGKNRSYSVGECVFVVPFGDPNGEGKVVELSNGFDMDKNDEDREFIMSCRGITYQELKEFKNYKNK